MPQTLVSIVIPVFNQLPYTRACLEAIRKNTGEISSLEVVVVDNCSGDGTSAFLHALKEKQDNLQVITLPSNLGFAAASNAGAQAARGQHLVFLNNDTEPQPGWLSELFKALSKENVGIAGPKLVYPATGTINHAGYVYNPALGFYPIYHELPADFVGVNKEREFQALLGACLLISKELFLRLGLFANYGLEDIDLCLKVREAGYRIIYCPASLVYHHGSVTLKRSAKGSFPETDKKEFNQRWPKSRLLQDDKEYYRSDGLGFRLTEDFTIEVYDQIAPSLQALAEAMERLAQGRAAEAIPFLKQAVDLYPHNVDAYLELICQLVQDHKTEEALQACRELIHYEPERYEGYLYLAQFQTKLGQKAQAQSTLQQLQDIKSLPADVRAKIKQLQLECR